VYYYRGATSEANGLPTKKKGPDVEQSAENAGLRVLGRRGYGEVGAKKIIVCVGDMEDSAIKNAQEDAPGGRQGGCCPSICSTVVRDRWFIYIRRSCKSDNYDGKKRNMKTDLAADARWRKHSNAGVQRGIIHRVAKRKRKHDGNSSWDAKRNNTCKR